ncbi:MAG: hypothetical protein GX596_03850 [Propionibacterium sp.]|nr:hypothetical protein [Propionibacterium sp.]
MRQFPRSILVVAACALALAGCGGESPAPAQEPEPAAAAAEPADEEPDETPADEVAARDEPAGTTIPDGAVPASSDFPFPVPEGWALLEPFAEGSIGGSDAVTGILEFPGDAEEAAAHYEALLKSAGYDAYPFALGAVVNDASILVEVEVAGTMYKGGIDFNTHADGFQKAVINLTVG